MSVSAVSDRWAEVRPAVVGLRAPAPTVGADGSLRWELARNCSLTPRQLLGVYLSLCALSLAIAAPFWWHGARVVLAFAGIELLVVGVALLVYCRHARDRETITIEGGTVHVEHHCGGRIERADFAAAWLRVEPQAAQGSMVELSGEGRRATVGRYLRPDLRAALAGELRRALRVACDFTPALQPLDCTPALRPAK